MGRTREGELSASNAAVLGLLIEAPDDAKGLEERLQERFVAAQWSYSTAHSALRSLKGQGYVSTIDATRAPLAGMQTDTRRHARPDISALLSTPQPPTTAASRERPAEGDTLYEATGEGTKAFWRWLRFPAPRTAIRDELRTKIAFSRPEDAPRLIELLEEEEREYEREYNALHESIGPLEDRMSAEAFIDGQDWPALMMVGLLRDEMTIWLAKQRQRERLREYLESLSAEALPRASSTRPEGR
jgi:DNA-binding PadR family transcriptional regulator